MMARVLVVDDEQSDQLKKMLRKFRALLESRGHEVAVFRTAAAAWLWLEQVKARSK